MKDTRSLISNALDEFKNAVGYNHVKCADIQWHGSSVWEGNVNAKWKEGSDFKEPPADETMLRLSVNYTDAEIKEFREKLDFDYNTYSDEVRFSGCIWLENGSCIVRKYLYKDNEETGVDMEWWDIPENPPIPDYLLKKEQYDWEICPLCDDDSTTLQLDFRGTVEEVEKKAREVVTMLGEMFQDQVITAAVYVALKDIDMPYYHDGTSWMNGVNSKAMGDVLRA